MWSVVLPGDTAGTPAFGFSNNQTFVTQPQNHYTLLMLPADQKQDVELSNTGLGGLSRSINAGARSRHDRRSAGNSR